MLAIDAEITRLQAAKYSRSDHQMQSEALVLERRRYALTARLAPEGRLAVGVVLTP